MMNFIYFNPDQLRADFLGCYGHPMAQTPNMDRLAAEGTRFDQCHVQHSVCTPSRCSFMTGWYPHVRGHRTLWHPLQKDEPNTLKYLKQHGYDVQWFGKNDLLSQDSFEQSVNGLHFPELGSQGSRDIFPKQDPRYWSFLYGPGDGHTHDWNLTERAITYLRNRKPEDPPFMLNMALAFPHPPFECPQPWYDMYDPDELPPMRPADLENKPCFHRLLREYSQWDQLDDATFRKARAVYLGMISYVDTMLGNLLNALEETGHAENTTVILFSDHGEWAGDYGLIEKWQGALDDCLTRVPMIVRTPGGVQGHVVKELIECFDIHPTTLELAKIPLQHTQFAISMCDQLQGQAGDPNRAVFAEGGYDPHEPHCFEGSMQDVGADPEGIYANKGRLQQDVVEASARSTMIRTQTHKLIFRRGDISELYDLQTDSNELNNLYGRTEHQAVQQSLEFQLLNWYQRTSDVVPYERSCRTYTEAVRAAHSVHNTAQARA
ncbi:sulfatase-like hydrolase/transferase [Coraliomargarita algicola]|uniref:Sulfatase-like hydrolase/transferase n=1 Tax=Coraliomargarita algicola TaxID=3092156 RepID=A0ABZ0RG61_9BACT|nr:sulfatase-like hydrolase/transferase [Coraliomargarita sp. J2-16]WPJ95159.1 sulfatase-like hydrolase/transferase [Coraliomargarita sp. J2-16]